MNGFLTSSEEQYLRTQHRLEKNRRVADRIKAVLLSHRGWTCQRIAEALLIDDETVATHIKEYKDSQKLHLNSGGSVSKLSAEQSEELVQHLCDHTYVRVGDICAYVLKTYGVSYTISGMTGWLHSHYFSYKQPKGTPCKADPQAQESWVKAYEKLMTEVSEDEPILFGDGVHPTMATKVTYGWIRKGQDKLIETTASRTRMNLFGALNLETMTAIISPYETLNQDSMVEYFGLLKQKYPNARKIHLILDRGPYNRAIKTQEAAREFGIILHYLPSYSPNLNPIERLWKVMNEYVRNNVFFKSAKEFREAILTFFEKTWPQIANSMKDRINDNFQIIKSAL